MELIARKSRIRSGETKLRRGDEGGVRGREGERRGGRGREVRGRGGRRGGGGRKGRRGGGRGETLVSPDPSGRFVGTHLGSCPIKLSTWATTLRAAAQKFLPRIDSYIDREALDEYPQDGEPIKLIMNGWFCHNPHKWPPSPPIDPLLISIRPWRRS